MRLLIFISGLVVGWSAAIFIMSATAPHDAPPRKLQVIPSAWSPPGCTAGDFRRYGREFVQWTCEVQEDGQ